MSIHGETYHEEDNRPLERAVIERFRDDEVLPSVDYLARREFVRKDFIGNQIGLFDWRTDAGASIAVKLEAEIISEPDERGNEQPLCKVNLTVRHSAPELMAELMKIAGAEIDARDARDLFQAWDVSMFEFSQSEQTPYIGICQQAYELTCGQMGFGHDVIWSSQDIAGPELDALSTINQADEDVLEALDSELVALTAPQRDEARRALIQLGVPVENLFVE